MKWKFEQRAIRKTRLKFIVSRKVLYRFILCNFARLTKIKHNLVTLISEIRII